MVLVAIWLVVNAVVVVSAKIEEVFQTAAQ